MVESKRARQKTVEEIIGVGPPDAEPDAAESPPDAKAAAAPADALTAREKAEREGYYFRTSYHCPGCGSEDNVGDGFDYASRPPFHYRECRHVMCTTIRRPATGPTRWKVVAEKAEKTA